MEKIIENVCKVIYEYYKELLSKYHKRVKFTGSVNNVYNLNDWILDIMDAVQNKDYENEFEIDNNIEDLLSILGYKDIIIKYKRDEELDDDGDWSNWTMYTSYKKEKNVADAELTFMKLGGIFADPIDIITFISKSIAAYEFEVCLDNKCNNDFNECSK